MNKFNIINTNIDLVTTDVKKVQLTGVRTNEYKKVPFPVRITKFR
jgi:hypothetical protein